VTVNSLPYKALDGTSEQFFCYRKVFLIWIYWDSNSQENNYGGKRTYNCIKKECLQEPGNVSSIEEFAQALASILF
jgi:hypothetical protein